MKLFIVGVYVGMILCDVSDEWRSKDTHGLPLATRIPLKFALCLAIYGPVIAVTWWLLP